MGKPGHFIHHFILWVTLLFPVYGCNTYENPGFSGKNRTGLSYNYLRFFEMTGYDKIAVIEEGENREAGI